jgi:tetratricopeptide (TPR) repeat protein
MLVQPLIGLGSVLESQGKMAEADERLLQAVALCERTRCGILISPGFYQLALISYRRGDFAAARDYARRMYEVTLQNIGPSHWRTAWAKMLWARYRAETGEIQAAVEDIGAAFPVVRAALPELSSSRWTPLFSASRVYNLASSYSKAEPLAREQIAILDHFQVPEVDWKRGASDIELATALAGEKKYREAAAAFQRAADVYTRLGSDWTHAAAEAQKKAAALPSK